MMKPVTTRRKRDSEQKNYQEWVQANAIFQYKARNGSMIYKYSIGFYVQFPYLIKQSSRIVVQYQCFYGTKIFREIL